MNIFWDKKLNSTLKELGAMFSLQTAALIKASSSLDERLSCLIAEKRKSDAALAQSIAASIENAAARLEAVKNDFEKSVLLIKESCEKMPKLNTASQINVKKINVVAREFGELRKAIIDSAQGGGNSAVEKLESISAALENNIGKTFDSINEILKANTEKLNASYEQFFEICKAISTEDTAPLESGNQVREEFVEKFIDSILVKKLGPNYGNILSLIETGDKNVVQRLVNHINHQIMTPYTKRFNDIEAELEQLEKDYINRSKKQNKIIVKTEHNGIIRLFNTWAANPRPPLPKAFYFIENDVDDLRIKFTIKESGNFESRWIVNREGRRKYLFPNPNAFDLYYLDLYDMNIEKLKRSWLVAIKIIKPCEINADGVITEKGELEIL